MDLQTVHPLPAEGRDQGGVNIQDAPGPAGGEVRREDGEEARQDDKVHPVLGKKLRKGGLKRLPAPQGLGRQGLPRDAEALGPRQGVGSLPVRDHKDDLPMGDAPLAPGVQQGLEIRAAAGDQHRDPCLFHASSPFR